MNFMIYGKIDSKLMDLEAKGLGASSSDASAARTLLQILRLLDPVGLLSN